MKILLFALREYWKLVLCLAMFFAVLGTVRLYLYLHTTGNFHVLLILIFSKLLISVIVFVTSYFRTKEKRGYETHQAKLIEYRDRASGRFLTLNNRTIYSKKVEVPGLGARSYIKNIGKKQNSFLFTTRPISSEQRTSIRNELKDALRGPIAQDPIILDNLPDLNDSNQGVLS